MSGRIFGVREPRKWDLGEGMQARERELVEILWVVDGVTWPVVVRPDVCPCCGAVSTITELPPPIRARQPDGTVMVCNPAFGGCNTGFALSISTAQVRR